MAYVLAALVLLTVIATSVTIVDALRAPHWRVVAVERRQSWRERTRADAEHDADHANVRVGAGIDDVAVTAAGHALTALSHLGR